MAAFSVSVALVTLMLIIPGAVFFRLCFGEINPLLMCCAPAITCFFFLIAGIVGTELGVIGVLPFVFQVALASVLFAFPFVLCNQKRFSCHESIFLSRCQMKWLSVAVCSVGGIIIVSMLFLSNIDGLSSYIQFDDNLSHLATIKSISELGRFSVLHSSSYDPAAASSAFIGGGSFYPIVWHATGALIVFITRVQTSLAENASIFCFMAFIYPTGIFAFLNSVCKKTTISPLLVVISSFASVAFPVRMLAVHGPFPNIAAFCLVPSVAALFVSSFSFDNHFSISLKIFYSFLLSLIGLVGVHPNAAIFTCVLIAPFVVLRVIPEAISCFSFAKLHSHTKTLTIFAQVVFCCSSCILWLSVYKLPFLKNIVSFSWEWNTTLFKIIKSFISGALYFGIPQPLLFPLFVLGLTYVLTQEEQLKWLLSSLGLAVLIFIGDGVLSSDTRSILCGFWYTDPERIAAMLAIALAPITYFGLHFVFTIISRLVERSVPSFKILCGALSLLFVTSIFIYLNFYPFNYRYTFGEQSRVHLTNAFIYNAYDLCNMYSRSRALSYTSAEMDFIQQVKEVIPEGSLVINMPYDGSSFAWSVDGLNLYYRAKPEMGESKESIAIRTGLFNYSSSREVRAAVEAVGAKYVLLLDRADYTYEDDVACYSRDLQFKKSDWLGITSIDDEVTGFELILSSGSMRLYQIAQ